MFSHPSHLMTLLRRPVAVWLALCLGLLGALAPTVSHALNGARGGNAGLIEVCTSNGPRWMALPGTTEPAVSPPLGIAQASDNPGAVTMWPDGPLSPAVFEHCPFCLLLLDRAAPPPQAWRMPLALAQASAAPMPLQAHYLPVFYAHTPPPRGPPISF